MVTPLDKEALDQWLTKYNFQSATAHGVIRNHNEVPLRFLDKSEVATDIVLAIRGLQEFIIPAEALVSITDMACGYDVLVCLIAIIRRSFSSAKNPAWSFLFEQESQMDGLAFFLACVLLDVDCIYLTPNPLQVLSIHHDDGFGLFFENEENNADAWDCLQQFF
jgi:hypothetical protein